MQYHARVANKVAHAIAMRSTWWRSSPITSISRKKHINEISSSNGSETAFNRKSKCQINRPSNLWCLGEHMRNLSAHKCSFNRPLTTTVSSRTVDRAWYWVGKPSHGNPKYPRASDLTLCARSCRKPLGYLEISIWRIKSSWTWRTKYSAILLLWVHGRQLDKYLR